MVGFGFGEERVFLFDNFSKGAVQGAGGFLTLIVLRGRSLSMMVLRSSFRLVIMWSGWQLWQFLRTKCL